MSERAEYELALPYFKQGDDISSCISFEERAVLIKTDLNKRNAVANGILRHAGMLEGAARDLRKLSAIVREHNVSVDGNSHIITVSGLAHILNGLEFEVSAFENLNPEDDEWEEVDVSDL